MLVSILVWKLLQGPLKRLLSFFVKTFSQYLFIVQTYIWHGFWIALLFRTDFVVKMSLFQLQEVKSDLYQR